VRRRETGGAPLPACDDSHAGAYVLLREALRRLHRHGQAAQRALAAVLADRVARARAPAALGGSMAGDGFVARHNRRRQYTGLAAGGRGESGLLAQRGLRRLLHRGRTRCRCAHGRAVTAVAERLRRAVVRLAARTERKTRGRQGTAQSQRSAGQLLCRRRGGSTTPDSRRTASPARALDAWGVLGMELGWIRNTRRLLLRLARPLRPTNSCRDADGSPPTVLPLSLPILSLRVRLRALAVVRAALPRFAAPYCGCDNPTPQSTRPSHTHIRRDDDGRRREIYCFPPS
jgi:hypothetical protein